MKKEEILKMSREENQNKDLAIIQIENKAVKYGALGLVLLSTVYFCLEIFIQGKTNYGWYSMIALYCGIVYGYKGVKSKNKRNILFSIIWIICSIAFIYSYIKDVILGAV